MWRKGFFIGSRGIYILEDEVATEVVYDVHPVTEIYNDPMIRLVKICLNIFFLYYITIQQEHLLLHFHKMNNCTVLVGFEVVDLALWRVVPS
jgi:hypothetical protein